MNREDFPILEQQVYKKPLVYLDNAATTQKPQVVIDAMKRYYETINSNIHRGVHCLSQQATEEFEKARRCVQQFINAAHDYEVIFTRGATESINLVASCFGRTFIGEGDEIIISAMEHHSNIVPWQFLCEERGAKLKVLPFDDDGVLCLDQLESLITPRTKIVAVTHVSNTLGTCNPVAEIIRIAHAHSVPVMLDGAQAVAHQPVDVQALDCDFYCFSGHKMYGPMGIGVMYGKEAWLNQMKPYQGGGEMISTVTFEKTTYNELPFKFEAGTPAVGDAIGLRTAIEYMQQIGIQNIARHEEELLQYATEKLQQINGLRIYGRAPHKAAVISFLIGNLHPYDVGVLLDHQGVAVRTGHHCTQPIMDRFGIPGTVRASFALYNTREEVDALVAAVERATNMLM
ncbi:MAG: cysteine desulfurase [Bacteroidales bacterium]|jgi:cysteine desulfurase/selenocysteine lyase|nr:cysteine desulfurase [Bacteroidales bacterium]